MAEEDLAPETLAEIEALAIELARFAGEEIERMLGRTLEVRYKGSAAAAAAFKDPVSEVDQRVEALLRERLAKRFPAHDIIGEEMDERPGRDHDTVWAIDPIDGTANFVNGLPLFAASLGVLHRGRPVVGALWCSTSHALRKGVYHTRLGGPLAFEGETFRPRRNAAVRRYLVGEPHAADEAGLAWDVRKTGSAAIECAFVAAGALRAARFERPNLWDVAGGVALVAAAGGTVVTGGEEGWEPFERFAATSPGGAPDLRFWRRPMALGDAAAVAALCQVR
jgi:myo-inositol-1(or 4)-monophosphatase